MLACQSNKMVTKTVIFRKAIFCIMQKAMQDHAKPVNIK